MPKLPTDRGAHRELRVGAGEGATHKVDDAARPATSSSDVAAVQLEVERRAAVAGTGPGGQVHTGAVCAANGGAVTASGPPLVRLAVLDGSPVAAAAANVALLTR